MNTESYPQLRIDLGKLKDNAQSIASTCADSGIMVSGVVKGCGGMLEVCQAMLDGGCESLGSSRIDQLKEIKKYDGRIETLLLRLPMQSEIDEVIYYADCSLNSDKETLALLNQSCERKNTRHKVVLMADLGDLREGIWYLDDLVELAMFVEFELERIDLHGVGTNLGCYGSIKPTKEKMMELSDSADAIEKAIGRQLDIVSGGATSSYPLVLNQEMPPKINHLRIGENILLGRDLKDYFGISMPEVHSDAFQLYGQIIEIQTKPSYPVGELFIDAFGNKPEYVDKGFRKRAIVAVGKQDFGDHEKLIPLNKEIDLVGSSSDHLIVDLTDDQQHYKTGDVLVFNMYYQPMLHLCANTEISKVFISPE